MRDVEATAERLENLWTVVRKIPSGMVASYGDVGQALASPLSGFFVGRLMANSPDDVPWWRVVTKDGRLPVWKIDPRLEQIQAQRLAAEGVAIEDGVVDMAKHRFVPYDTLF